MNRQLDFWHFIPFFITHFLLIVLSVDHWLYSLKEIIVGTLCICSLESEFIEEIVENIWKILNEEESATAPSRRQHSVPIIPPQNDASSRHNDISEWTPPFFSFIKNFCSRNCLNSEVPFFQPEPVFLTLNNIKRKSYSAWSRFIPPFVPCFYSSSPPGACLLLSS